MNVCFECGCLAVCEHHVIPIGRGGTKTLWLCDKCHALAHHRNEHMSTSVLTHEGLVRAKARGVKLGSARPGHWDGREHLREAGRTKAQPLGAAANSQKAKAWYQDVLVPKIKRRREAGETLATISTWLNEQGFRTRPTKRYPEGGAFTPMQVWRLIDRYVAPSTPAGKQQ